MADWRVHPRAHARSRKDPVLDASLRAASPSRRSARPVNPRLGDRQAELALRVRSGERLERLDSLLKRVPALYRNSKRTALKELGEPLEVLWGRLRHQVEPTRSLTCGAER